MDSGNPYAAPQAAVGQTNLGDLAGALGDFQRSRGPLLFLAIACLLMAVFSTASTIMVYATAFDVRSGSLLVAWVAMGSNVLTYIIASASLMWLRADLRDRGRTPSLEQVSQVFRALARSWLIITGLLFVPVISMLSLRIVPMMAPAIGAAIAGLATNGDAVAAAQRWRNAVKIALIVGGAMVLLRVASTMFTPLFTLADMGWASLQARVYLFGGIIVQVGFGFLAWRQVPALEAFVATPNATTLAAVAATHRSIWRLTAFASIALLALSLVAGIASTLLLAF